MISKGINKGLIDEYIDNNKEMLLDYEIKSAKNILLKKQNQLDKNDIVNYLVKKRYMQESIKTAIIEIEE